MLVKNKSQVSDIETLEQQLKELKQSQEENKQQLKKDLETMFPPEYEYHADKTDDRKWHKTDQETEFYRITKTVKRNPARTKFCEENEIKDKYDGMTNNYGIKYHKTSNMIYALLNNVFFSTGGGTVWLNKQSTLLTDEEVTNIRNGIVPERLKRES